MHKIIVSLGNIGDAVRQLDEYENKVKQNIKDFLSKLLETGVEISRAKITELGAIDSGELQGSLNYALYREGNKGVLFTDCEYACFIEFGTGVKYNGSAGSSKHPKGQELGMTIGSYGEGQGANPDGWYYYDDDKGKVMFTKGMPHKPFMYETGKELERIAVKIAKEVFSR